MVLQWPCSVPVAPGSSYTYNLTVNQNGIYWDHCRIDYCYPGGHRAPFIVHDNKSYFCDDYDDDMTVTTNDWYHALAEEIKPESKNL